MSCAGDVSQYILASVTAYVEAQNEVRAFIIYLVRTNQPFAEILAPTRLDIAQEFARGFDGITDSPVTLDDLIQAREHLIAEILGKMPIDHRRFLLSLKKGEPEWPLLGVPGAEALPAVRSVSSVYAYTSTVPLQ